MPAYPAPIMTMSDSEGRSGVDRIWSRGERSVSQKGRVELGGGRNCFSILVSRLIPYGYMGVVVLKASLPKVILYRNIEASCDFLMEYK